MSKQAIDVKNLAGSPGGEYFADTSAHTPAEGSPKAWMAIQAVNGADAVFSAVTSNITNLSSGLTLPSGHIIYGRFTALTLASGAVICYKE